MVVVRLWCGANGQFLSEPRASHTHTFSPSLPVNMTEDAVTHHVVHDDRDMFKTNFTDSDTSQSVSFGVTTVTCLRLVPLMTTDHALCFPKNITSHVR